jgi:predicted Zn-dependent protease
MLGRVAGGEGGRVPTWLSTHPDPLDRREAILREIAALSQPLEGRTVAGDAYVARLDGLIYGANPREGFFRDTRFLHPELAFEITFPAGWKTANQKHAVMALSPEQDAMVEVTLAGSATLDAAASAFFDPRTMRGPTPRRTRIGGYPAIAGEFVATTEQGELAGMAAFVEHERGVFRILGYGTPQTWSARDRPVGESVASFARLTERAALDIQPMRLAIVRLPGPMSLSEFVARYPSEVPREQVALINQAELTTQYPAGALLKRVVRSGRAG